MTAVDQMNNNKNWQMVSNRESAIIEHNTDVDRYFPKGTKISQEAKGTSYIRKKARQDCVQ